MRLRLPVTAALALTLLGCADRTALLVVVHSTDLHVGADVDTLHFEARGASGTTAMGDYRITNDWPQSLAVRPARGGGGDVVTVTVLGLLGDTIVARSVRSATLVSGQTVTVDVPLVRCISDCGTLTDGGGPDGGPPSDMPPTDLGVDGGVDLGPVDGGVDLGPVDGGVDLGPRDLGPPDLGTDLGPPDLGMPGSCATGSCATHLVISEVATGGPTTGNDEFVEIYNPTGGAIDASGLLVEYRSAGGATWSGRAQLPAGAMIASHGYYLVVSMAYTGAPAGDPSATSPWTTGMASAGGHVHLVLGGTELDRLGWGTGAVMPEGAAAPGFSSDSNRSYERKAFSTSDLTSMTTGLDATHGNSFDDDDNLSDFVVRAMRNPQNSASPAEDP